MTLITRKCAVKPSDIETGPSTSSAHFHGVGGAAATPLGSLTLSGLWISEGGGGGGNLWQAGCGWLLWFLDELCLDLANALRVLVGQEMD